jgi:thymidylate synthase
MNGVDHRHIVAPTLSDAWLEKARLLLGVPGGKLVHLVVRIEDPTVEVPAIRAEADALIDAHNAKRGKEEMVPIDTVRNTIFPVAYAERTRGPKELGEHYRTLYDPIRKSAVINRKGTYFGRMVAYPRADDEPPADQLLSTVEKLKDELDNRGPKSSCYEINIYSEARDTGRMSFPCLAHLSVHLHDRAIHLQAIYRNETLIGRAYGNWLGLAELQQYIARCVGANVGELLITAGHVELESGHKRMLGAMLERLDGSGSNDA